MKVTITGCKPRAYYRHYSEPSCQNSLIRTAGKWPLPERSQILMSHFKSIGIYCDDDEYGADFARGEPRSYEANIPDDCDIGSYYIDRIEHSMWGKFVATLLGDEKECGGGINTLLETAKDANVLAAASLLFNAEVIGFRAVYYFNQATGYDCQRFDAIYKRREDRA